MRLLLLTFLLSTQVFSQSDSTFIRSIYDEALENGHAYKNLRSLCKDIGSRLTGSAEATMAVEWSKKLMESYDFDKVYLQEVEVPHWERGTKEACWIQAEHGNLTKLNVLALGGSIATDGLLKGEVVEFKTLDALKNATKAKVENKIVFLNHPMDAKFIETFRAYGGCYPIRGSGAVEGAKLGAKAVVIRSLGLPIDEHPHTGSMHYEEGVKKIPAAAIATKDAELLSELMKNAAVELTLEMDCKEFPPTTSYNVIGEIKGSTHSEEIITVGGHLDSWDTGEGAHDDGAGVMHSLEALRILKALDYLPKHTLRVVFFMNEENGNMGGKTYAKRSSEKGEKLIAAIESDAGGFAPRGFNCNGSEEQVAFLQSLGKEFKPYLLHQFKAGFAGVDIHPLRDYYENIPLFGFIPDSQRYFDMHHSPNDIFENVNKRELELGCASIASLIYLIDSRF